MRWLKLLGPLLGFSLLAYLILIPSLQRFGAAAESEVPIKGMRIGAFTLPTLDGKTISKDDLLGKPAYLNFWATWCKPCRMEMPKIQEVFRERGREVNFVMVNLKEGPDVIRSFMAENGYTLPVALDDGTLYEKWGLRGIPTSVFIDRQGTICLIVEGAMGKEYIEWALDKASAGCRAPVRGS